MRALIVLCILVAGCAKPWSPVEPAQVTPVQPTAAEWRVTDHVLLVTDASGTMAREALLPEAKAVSQAFVAGMPEPTVRAERPGTYEASLLSFGGSERIEVPHAAFNRSAMADGAKSIRPLGQPVMGSLTPLDDALGEAAGQLEGKRGRAAVVIVGDGIADDAGDALAAGQALVASYPDQICIHTVQSGDSPEGRDLFAKLAALSKGGCGSSRSAAGLNDAAAMQDLERDVFLAAAPLPAVAAGPDCAGRLVLRGVEFDFDKADLRPESAPVLDAAAEQLTECPNLAIAVEGHTCSIGTDDYNADLSNRRAATVRDYLVSHGVAAERLSSVGRGEAGPVASNDTRDGRAQNRRVELLPAVGAR